MPSDSKKKRDLQKKTAAKQRQAQSSKKSNNTANTDPIDDDLIEDSDGIETPTENENPTNGTTNDIDPNIKSVIQNLDLLTMVEKANAEARACTGEQFKNYSFLFLFLF
jgi:hypothetical protein